MDAPLRELDALVGLPLHSFESLDPADFAGLPPHTKTYMCDALYASISWCRELLSCFSCAAHLPEIKAKLIQRLSHIVEMEKELENYAAQHTSWVPLSQLSESQPAPAAGPKKEPKEKEDAAASPKPRGKPSKGELVHLEGLRKHYRALSTEAISTLLGCLEEELVQERQDTEGECEETMLRHTPLTAQYMLRELLTQLQSTFKRAMRTATPFGASRVSKQIQFGPPQPSPSELCQHMQIVLPALQKFVADGLNDEDGTKLLCECLKEAYEYTASLDEGGEKEALMRSLLQPWASPSEEVPVLLSNTLDFFWENLLRPALQEETNLRPDTMLEVLELLRSLADLGKSCNDAEVVSSLKARTSEAAHKMLHSESSKTATPQQLASMLKYFITHAPEPLMSISVVVTQISYKLGEDPESLDTSLLFPTSDMNSLMPVFFKVGMDQLTTELGRQVKALEESRESPEVSLGVLKEMEMALKLMKEVTHGAKAADNLDGCKHREVLVGVLKHGKRCVMSLLKMVGELGHCLTNFKEMHGNYVIAVLKLMQKSTRAFHAFCNYAKEQKDGYLIKLVPAIKKALESLMLRAKGFVDRGCTVTTGNLKNRNLKNEVVCSQIFQQEEEREESISLAPQESGGEEEGQEVDEEDENACEDLEDGDETLPFL